MAITLRNVMPQAALLALSLAIQPGSSGPLDSTVAVHAHGSTEANQRSPSRAPTRDPRESGVARDDIDCSFGVSATLQASATEVAPEAPVTLTWSITRFAGCTHVRVFFNGQAAAPRGSQTVRPITATRYALTMRQDNQPITLAQVEVKVVPGRVVHIKGSTPDWAQLLVTAVGRPNTTVRLAENVDMDLSIYDEIWIAGGVNLTSEQEQDPTVNGRSVASRGGGRGAGNVISRIKTVRTGTRVGPRLYTTNRPARWFRIYCDATGVGANNVRLNGFRLIGPHFESMEGDDNLEKGIFIISCRNIEISNMELAGWSGAAVYVIDDHELNEDVNEVRIFDNYFHHNQHKGGNGYGVDVNHGATASIFHNVFDFNRHAITASGKKGVKYRAHENLVLKGGGVHDRVWNEYTHQFDIHGDGEGCSLGNLCGNAGEEFWFTNNAFQYVNDNAIKIRGRPRKQATISFNVFPHEGLEDDAGKDAINLPRDREHVKIGPGNVIGFEAYGRYGVCDFDGDGRDDLFLPTGVTWWISSAARMHWTFLRSATQKLDEVGLGYFDRDARCDVVARNGDRLELSSGGTGPWVTLETGFSVPFDQLRFADFNGDGVTDVFRRAEDGQWSIISPGGHVWRPVASSSYELSDFRFGDFDGDNITDVIRRSGAGLSYSRNATEVWKPLNPNLDGDLSTLLIGDIDNNGIDDIVRYTQQSGPGIARGTWHISRDGRTGWQRLGSVDVPALPLTGSPVGLLFFSGRFDDKPGVDLLHADYLRMGRVTGSRGATAQHSLYAY